MTKKSTATYTARRYTAEDAEIWNEFVASSKNATFLFNRNFMEYHSDRFDDFSILIFKNETLFAALPANRVENKVYSHQGLTYGSFILQESAKLLNVFEAYKTLLQFLETEGIKQLEIRIIPTFYNKLPSDELSYFLFKSNATLVKKDVLMLIDTTYKLRFQKNRRETIKKGIRNNLTLKLENNFDFFWEQLLIPNTVNRHGVKPVHTLKEIKLLASRFPHNIEHINVYKGDEIVAGSTIFLTDTTIHPQYISHNHQKNAAGAIDVMYDFLINHYKKDRRFFDFNISSEKQGTLLNSGLIFWKESYGARSHTADTYVVNTDAYKTIDLHLI